MSIHRALQLLEIARKIRCVLVGGCIPLIPPSVSAPVPQMGVLMHMSDVAVRQITLAFVLNIRMEQLTGDVTSTSAPSLLTFRKRLKLHLFQLSYPGLVL